MPKLSKQQIDWFDFTDMLHEKIRDAVKENVYQLENKFSSLMLDVEVLRNALKMGENREIEVYKHLIKDMQIQIDAYKDNFNSTYNLEMQLTSLRASNQKNLDKIDNYKNQITSLQNSLNEKGDRNNE